MSGNGTNLSVEQWHDKIAESFEPESQLLIPILQFVQSEAGYLPREAMAAVAQYLRVSSAKVYGVASFYAQFYFEPRGRNRVTVCRGTACHVRGSGRMLRELESQLGIEAGATTEDLQFLSLETVSCFGACALAPVVVINDRVHGAQASSVIKGAIDALRAPAADAATSSAEAKVG